MRVLLAEFVFRHLGLEVMGTTLDRLIKSSNNMTYDEYVHNVILAKNAHARDIVFLLVPLVYSIKLNIVCFDRIEDDSVIPHQNITSCIEASCGVWLQNASRVHKLFAGPARLHDQRFLQAGSLRHHLRSRIHPRSEAGHESPLPDLRRRLPPAPFQGIISVSRIECVVRHTQGEREGGGKDNAVLPEVMQLADIRQTLLQAGKMSAVSGEAEGTDVGQNGGDC